MSIYYKINEQYVYGPVSKQEVQTLAVHHKLTYENGDIYIGTSIPIDYLENRLVPREIQSIEEQ